MPKRKIVGNTTATPIPPNNTPNLEEFKVELEQLFATKEEVGNIESGLDAIIEALESIKDFQDELTDGWLA